MKSYTARLSSYPRRFYLSKPFKATIVAVFLFFLASAFIFLPSQAAGRQRGEAQKPSLAGARSYANAYGTYDAKALSKFMKFDVVIIEPYNVPNIKFLKKLKEKGVIIIAYISVGEAGANRRYFKNWRSYVNTPDNPEIPRSKVKVTDPVFIGEDPGWPGSYYADASSQKWHDIVLNEEMPYILWLGHDLYDGFFLDVLDAADVYKTMENGDKMTEGLIELVKKMRREYPCKLLIANRGFTILKKIAPYIDGFKYEEYTSAYGNIKNEAHYKKYYLKFDKKGKRLNTAEVEILKEVLKINPQMPIFVLDHVKTKPLDIKTARFCYKEAVKLGAILKCKILWYANSVNQDLPIWPEFNK
jgi:uncharacterized protein (TIGR01370 family)